MKKVFVCSPFRGDVEYNTERARGYCRAIALRGMMPVAPHLFFPQFLDDDLENERELGLSMSLEALQTCCEVWAFGKPTVGMLYEMTHAMKCGIPVYPGEDMLGGDEG